MPLQLTTMGRTAFALGLAIVFLSGMTKVAGQQSSGTAIRSDPSRVPRTPWGVPDLQGRWTNATVTLLERPAELGNKEFFSESEAAAYQQKALERFLAGIGFTEEASISGEFVEGLWVEKRHIVPTGRTSLIVGADGRLPPFTPEARGRAEARAALRKLERSDGPEDRTLQERCLYFQVGGPPMLPSVGYNSNYEIVQTPTQIAILAEQGAAVRIIPLDGRPHIDSRLREWRGDSRGRWDNDTLVVETTNFNDKRDLRGSGSGLRLIERFRRVNADVILYEFTAEDVSTWVRPWTAEIPMRKLEGLIYEFACHEGNYALPNILNGARFAETQQQR
jgi:hypothetical protein